MPERFPMSRATPQALNFAKRLLVYETNGRKLSKTQGQARTPLQVYEKLRPLLQNLMGKGGFRSLLSRSLELASAEVPWLRAARVSPDGILEGLEEAQAQLGPDELAKGEVALFAELLGLLMAFIGGNLTLRLVREIWPKVPLNDLGIGKGDNNEKVK
jgi:hypothetical protein